MGKKDYMTLERALTPMQMACVHCGSTMTVYPCPMPKGTGVCPKCSPSWLGSFALHMTNQERGKHGLVEIK